MKKFYILFMALIVLNSVSSQPCLPEGIIFSTQEQIDNFQINYPNCTEIEGDVFICNWDPTNINNLDGLSVLTSIGGDLIIYKNPYLTSLTGLNNVTSLGGLLLIYNNESLTSLTGLNNVTSIGGHLQIGDSSYGFGNPALTSLTALENVTSIGGWIQIEMNESLISLIGLNNVTSIEGTLKINDNDALTSLTGLDNMTSIGGSCCIMNNSGLTSLIGLNSVTSVGGWIQIEMNESLTSLSGLNNVTSIGETLKIFNNGALTSLTGLDHVTSIGGWLLIHDNDALTSLTGLDNVISMGVEIYIKDNWGLTSLTGLDNVDAGSIITLLIFDNHSLSTCEVKSVCEYLVSPNGTFDIHHNATGCNSEEEVETACATISVENFTPEPTFSIYSNPTSVQITIETPTAPFKNTILTIYDLNGQQVIEQQITEETTVIDVSSLVRGVYIVKLTDDSTVKVSKLIKQ